MIKRISIDRCNDKHEIYSINLQHDCSQYNKPGKYVACFYDGDRYVGIRECFNDNQDCNIKFIKRNNLNLRWIADTCFSF